MTPEPLDLAPYMIRNPGRDLALIGVRKRRRPIILKALDMRRSMGMTIAPEWEGWV